MAPRLLLREPEVVDRDLDHIAWRWTERTLPPPETSGIAQRDRRLVLLLFLLAAILFWTPVLLMGSDLHPGWVVAPIVATAGVALAGFAWLRRLVSREVPRQLIIDRVQVRLDGRVVPWSKIDDIVLREDTLEIRVAGRRSMTLGHPLRPSHLARLAEPMLAVLAARR